jgi:hypothetical protein
MAPTATEGGRSGEATDIAQTVQIGAGASMVLQWNEPYDPVPPTPIGTPIATGTGTVPPGGDSNFPFAGTAGMLVEIFADAEDSTTGEPTPDLTLELIVSPTTSERIGRSALFIEHILCQLAHACATSRAPSVNSTDVRLHA